MNTEKIENNIKELLDLIGEDSTRSGLIETPKRVAKAYAEMFQYIGEKEFKDYKLFDNESNTDIVLLSDIDFYSMCEHHLVPFFGTVDIAYIPNEQIIGLSKMPRLVEWAAKRPSVQEQLTSLIGTELDRILNAKGVAVRIKARHLCMEMRGIKKVGGQTQTTFYSGAFESAEYQEKFYNLLNVKN